MTENPLAHTTTRDTTRSSLSEPISAQQRALLRWFTRHERDTGQDWRAQALCAQVDPEIFFPKKGANPAQAKAVCAMCPVRNECLEHALTHIETYGIWGGLTARQRQELRAGRRSSVDKCRNGHEYTPENTLATTFGRRCRTCKNASDRAAGRRRDGNG